MMSIFKSMVKEEWRVHSSMLGGFMFALFPIVLLMISFVGTLFLPIIQRIIPSEQIVVMFQYAFLLFGVSIGSFGLMGKEVMNRRFGQASLIAYSSRSLPVSERIIFSNFILKDIVYYFFLWILPIVGGFALASLILSIGMAYVTGVLIIASLAFLLGMSASFFLSTVYAHSSKVAVAILVLGTAALGALAYNGLSISTTPFLSFPIPSYEQTVLIVIAISLPIVASLIFLKVDYPQRTRIYKNSINTLSVFFKASSHSNLMAKDFLDFERSEGGIGKILFSFLLPLALMWAMISVLANIVPFINPFMIFSVFMGIMSSSFYNWFTEFDAFSTYSFLPMKVSTLMRGKMSSFAFICSVPMAVLIAVTAFTGQWGYFIPAFCSFLAMASYSTAITLYLSGLNPNILIYSAKTFLEYMALLVPVLLATIFLSAIPMYMIASLALVPVSYAIVRKSYQKWDRKAQPSF